MSLCDVEGGVGCDAGGAETVFHGGVRWQPGRQDRHPRGNWFKKQHSLYWQLFYIRNFQTNSLKFLQYICNKTTPGLGKRPTMIDNLPENTT